MKLLLFAIGFAVACLFPNSSPGAERRSVLFSVEFDGGDDPGKDRIELYAETNETCKAINEVVLAAAYIYRPVVSKKPELNGATVEGCYVIQSGMVFMFFADGDRGRMPLSKFTASRGI